MKESELSKNLAVFIWGDSKHVRKSVDEVLGSVMLSVISPS